MKVWVIMERWTVSDDGNDAIEIEAVHASEAGAQANLEPDYRTSGYPPGSRERYIVEMDVIR